MLVGCTAESIEISPFTDRGGKADGVATRLTLRDDHRLHVDEPSDLAIDGGGALYTVSDRHSTIYRIDDDGDVEDELDVRGADLEALAIDADGRFHIADESAGTVWRLHDDGERDDKIDLDADDGNSGIEGLAFDDRGHLFVAKEKDPARIYELDAEGDLVGNTKIEFADDLSALAWNPSDGYLYALSDEDHALYRLDADLDVHTAWRLPIEHPEGLAFAGDTVYIASDSEERLYVLELDAD